MSSSKNTIATVAVMITIMMVMTASLVQASATGAVKKTTRWYDLERVGYGFGHFKAEHGKSYATASEEATRKAHFESNLQTILEHNRRPGMSWKLGVNHLADRSPDELKALRGYRRPKTSDSVATGVPHIRSQTSAGAAALLPTSIDYRTKGAVTPVKDQGQCGSCWAFASTQAVESFWYLKTGKIMDLSPQQVASCSEIPPSCLVQGNGGCDGSSQVVAFSSLMRNGGLTSEWVYPYNSGDGTNYKCKFRDNTTVGALVTLSNYSVVKSNSHDDLMDALANKGPVAITV
eukprot:PhM_4_TR10350/c2_g1_i1/m.80216